MGQVLLGVAITVVVFSVAAVLLIRQRRRVARGGPWQIWAVARANTADGATAHLQVEAVIEASAPLPVGSALDGPALRDAVEEQLRRRITGHPVAALPSVGDGAPFVAPGLPSGMRVTHAVVTTSDVEVTPGLRRLVTDQTA
ncbi:hypothetical protein [Nocardioides sp. AE5]|uniref:hypothetical protein n=1 Tax=Nocardioides sp. AE5 TaxID=2962573 RepID=UPI002881619D|nr:hypothetical protein [Nocardioides sp. AE5]MDT0201056.1 hypothetical protein [Nocardioides sp. AE5]